MRTWGKKTPNRAARHAPKNTPRESTRTPTGSAAAHGNIHPGSCEHPTQGQPAGERRRTRNASGKKEADRNRRRRRKGDAQWCQLRTTQVIIVWVMDKGNKKKEKPNPKGGGRHTEFFFLNESITPKLSVPSISDSRVKPTITHPTAAAMPPSLCQL